MKRGTLYALAFLIPLFAGAQSVYKVPADTKGNSIVLTLANESATIAAQGLSVRLLGSHPGLTLSSPNAALKTLQAAASADLTFQFAVGRDVKLGNQDTLLFEIRDKTGDSWLKSIVLEYTGPQEYKLDQNFPNPFNPTTTIYYDLPSESKVTIGVYDILGREVAKIVNETEPAGYQSVRWDARNVASGAYIYRMIAQPLSGARSWTNVKKMVVLR
jgi:hypothetical protein